MAKEQMIKEQSNNMNSLEMAQEQEPYDVKELAKDFIKRYWKNIFFIIWPLALSWIIFGPWNDGVTFFEESNGGNDPGKHPKGYENRYIFRTMYIFLVMSGYWLTECIPMHLTGKFISKMQDSLMFIFVFIDF